MDAYGFFLPLVLLSFLLLPLAQATKIRYCDHEGDYDVKVSGVKVSPNPVVSGQPATFTISASADQPITGGNLVIDVAYWGVHIHKETHSLCEKTDCPISAGKFVLSHTQKLPGITPPGSYTLTMTMTGPTGYQLTCISFGFKIILHESVAES